MCTLRKLSQHAGIQATNWFRAGNAARLTFSLIPRPPAQTLCRTGARASSTTLTADSPAAKSRLPHFHNTTQGLPYDEKISCKGWATGYHHIHRIYTFIFIINSQLLFWQSLKSYIFILLCVRRRDVRYSIMLFCKCRKLGRIFIWIVDLTWKNVNMPVFNQYYSVNKNILMHNNLLKLPYKSLNVGFIEAPSRPSTKHGVCMVYSHQTYTANKQTYSRVGQRLGSNSYCCCCGYSRYKVPTALSVAFASSRIVMNCVAY